MIRKSVLLAAAALLAAHHAARADDPPAPKPPAPPASGEPAKPAPATEPGTNPAAKRHENKISAEAKAAFERMEKISNCPVKQGLTDASGTIETEIMGMPTAMKFTFKAPDAIHVEMEGDAQKSMPGGGRMMTRGIEQALRPQFGIYHPADDAEFDADLVKKDGHEVLALTNYKDGVETSRTEFTLGAEGLIATAALTSQAQMGAEKREVKTDVTYTWTKAGDRYHLSQLETSRTGGEGPGAGGGGRGAGGGRGGMGGGMGGGKTTISYTYTELDKFALATSWTISMGGGPMQFEQRITDLTVNGKKVEIKKPEVPAPAAPPAPKDGGDKGGEGVK